MNRMSRNVLAAALSAVVALGAAPAAVAGPHGHGHGHSKGDKVTAKAVKKERHARAGQGRTYSLAKQADRKAELPRPHVDRATRCPVSVISRCRSC